LDQIKGLENERKCFRIIGGILVEKTIGEAIPALDNRIKNEVN